MQGDQLFRQEPQTALKRFYAKPLLDLMWFLGRPRIKDAVCALLGIGFNIAVLRERPGADLEPSPIIPLLIIIAPEVRNTASAGFTNLGSMPDSDLCETDASDPYPASRGRTTYWAQSRRATTPFPSRRAFSVSRPIKTWRAFWMLFGGILGESRSNNSVRNVGDPSISLHRPHCAAKLPELSPGFHAPLSKATASSTLRMSGWGLRSDRRA